MGMFMMGCLAVLSISHCRHDDRRRFAPAQAAGPFPEVAGPTFAADGQHVGDLRQGQGGEDHRLCTRGLLQTTGAVGRLDEASVGGRRNLPFNLFCGV
jgi:hypothetical protein